MLTDNETGLQCSKQSGIVVKPLWGYHRHSIPDVPALFEFVGNHARVL
jgi:hypothetical protein